jgi:hypothetical protein
VSITLKYIKANTHGENAVVPFDLINILLDLIAKITFKSKQLTFELQLSQFLNIFEQILDIIAINNQFELWL